MDILGIRTVLVPPNPGNVSAFGLLTVDVRNDYVRTHVAFADGLDADAVSSLYDDLAAQARTALSREGFAEEQHRLLRTADLRYFGQAFEVRVPVPDGVLDGDALSSVADGFHAEHRALYGYDFAGDVSQPVEWVNLRVTGVGPIKRPEIRRADPPENESPDADPLETFGRVSERPVCFDAEEGYVATQVVWREDLGPGVVLAGPAIIEEFGSTVPLHPGFAARVDEYLNLVVTREEVQA
jgi:N-methylhydantoinase A